MASFIVFCSKRDYANDLAREKERQRNFKDRSYGSSR